MRESFGGAFMIKLVLIFIVIYISFMAVAINYAKAFRVKNNIINILEQYKYSGNKSDVAFKKVEEYLPKVPYRNGNDKIKQKCDQQASLQRVDHNYSDFGVCLLNISGNTTPKYFKVVTYISIDFPFFNIHMIIPISGETKSIYS